MDNSRNQQMASLAGASRVAGRRGGFATRTHYLSQAELRTVPATRLLRETAWAERPDASDQWQDQRRAVVADEFYRRGFTDAADTVRPRWDAAKYDGSRGIAEQRRLDAERHQLDTEPGQTGDREAETVAWAVTTLATAGAAATVLADEQTMQQVTGQLDQVWEGEAADPAISGDLDTGIGADLADSLSADAAPAASEATFESSTPAATPDVETEAEL